MSDVAGGVPDPRPRFPKDRSGVAILGCGTIAQSAHLPAYEQYGVGVVGVWSRTRPTTERVGERFPFVRRVYDDAEELLAAPPCASWTSRLRPRADWRGWSALWTRVSTCWPRSR